MPLYYQLQEVLKEQIESGTLDARARRFRPSPNWPAASASAASSCARRSRSSRTTARSSGIKGRGTFVAEPKLDARAGGLSRSLVVPRPAQVAIQALDVRTAERRGRRSARELEAGADEDVLRVTTLPVAARRAAQHQLLVLPPRGGRLARGAPSSRAATCPADLVLADHGIELAHARIAVETSQCGQFEADRFGIPHRASVFLAVCTEFRRDGTGTRPFEVARVEYRGDLLRFRLEVVRRRAGRDGGDVGADGPGRRRGRGGPSRPRLTRR